MATWLSNPFSLPIVFDPRRKKELLGQNIKFYRSENSSLLSFVYTNYYKSQLGAAAFSAIR